MKLNKYLMTGVLVALVGIGVVGCSEPIAVVNTVGTVSRLEANSMSTASVALRWTPSTTVGATYLVAYRKIGGVDTGSSATAGQGVSVTGNTALVTELTGSAYIFYVYAVSGTDRSYAAAITWAPATRYSQDAKDTTITLRMYEFASGNGSGLILDPTKGGPRNASVAAGGGDPAGSIALAIYTVGLTDQFDIGPAYAFTGFRNADKFDSSSYISKDAFSVNSLDDLYLRNSLETYIRPSGDSAGNISAFRLPAVSSDGKGVAYLMRVGNAPLVHYARVVVKPDASGRHLRSSAPNRYVEVEISYQSTPNVPYAKGVVRKESVATYHSIVPYPLN